MASQAVQLLDGNTDSMSIKKEVGVVCNNNKSSSYSASVSCQQNGAWGLPRTVTVDSLPEHAIVRVVFTTGRQLAFWWESFRKKGYVNICFDFAVYAN